MHTFCRHCDSSSFSVSVLQASYPITATFKMKAIKYMKLYSKRVYRLHKYSKVINKCYDFSENIAISKKFLNKVDEISDHWDKINVTTAHI